jgi:CheY-like chemotaxis protein
MAATQRRNKKRRVRLVAAKSARSSKMIALLRAAGHVVACGPLSGAVVEGLKRRPPDVVAIDLDRAPASGRDLALWLRKTKATRHLPLVIIEGDAEKTARLCALLPDAVRTSPERIRGAVRQALAHPPATPVVPASAMAGYSGTPLPKKLGIKAGSVVILAGAPDGFETTLGELPDGVTLRRAARGRCDLAIWFVRSRRELERRVVRMGELAGKGGLWIAWPKQTSGIESDVTQHDVRAIGLASGLVDYRICAIDRDWSGLRFARRKQR